MQTIIELKYPVSSNGENLNKLTMRRSKVRDRLVVAKMKNSSNEEKEINLFANLCEVTPSTIEELDESDYVNLQQAYTNFFDFKGMSLKQLSSSQK